MGVSNTCDEGAQCAQVANIGPIVDAPPFMAGEDVHVRSKRFVVFVARGADGQPEVARIRHPRQQPVF